MYNCKLLSVKEVSNVIELEVIYEYIKEKPEHSSFIDGVPNREEFMKFFLENGSNVLYIVEYNSKVVGYGYVEYETDTTGRCHWGLTEFTPNFFYIIRDVLSHICMTTTLINIFAPIHNKNRVARKIAERLGYEKVFTMYDYYNNEDFDMYLYYNKLNLFSQ